MALFSPLALRGLEVRNRIVISPMCQYSAVDGCATDWHSVHWGQLLLSGAGMFIIEATGVSATGRITPGCLGLYDDANEAALGDRLGRAPAQAPAMPAGPGYQVAFARDIKRATGATTMAVGMITEPVQAETIVASGDADLVAMARAFLWDPRWPWRAAVALGGKVSAPQQYWRSVPREAAAAFGEMKVGQR